MKTIGTQTLLLC